MEIVLSNIFVKKYSESRNKNRYNIDMIIESHHTNESLAVIHQLEGKLSHVIEENRWLREQLNLAQSKIFGKSSEKYESIQFELFGGDQPEIEAPEVEKPDDEIVARRKKSVGRRIDTSKLPREQIVHDLLDNEKCCKSCQNQLVKIGEDRSEQLEYIPAQVKVIEHVRIKYTCRTCVTVIAGEKPASPVPKSMAGASLLAAVIVSKYQYHLPMYRQSQIFLTNGIDIPPNTLVNWALSAYEVLAPISTALWEQLKMIHVLQADETRVKLLDINKQGYMWCYLSCDPNNRFVLFAYDDSRGSHAVNDHLGSFTGLLQTDGYSGYNNLREKEDIVSFGCFAHCRRKFVDAQKVSDNKSGKAQYAIELIRKLYKIEEEAVSLTFTDRKLLRQKDAKPLLYEFHKWLEESSLRVGKKSKLADAINYALNQWKYLSAYIDHGEVEIDNNWVENQIRPFALGRKNWLFVGNQRGADAAAMFYSLIQTCKLNDIPPGQYLTYLLGKVEAMRKGTIDVKSLLPQFVDKSQLSLGV
jgi:transposase